MFASPADLVLSLREQITDRLRIDVLCGRLAEDEKLDEVRLATRFGVSRSPVREAIQRLMHEGLVVGRRHVGVRVARRPPESICELAVPMRRRVEVFALRSYFHDIGGADFELWGAIVERMRIACETAAFESIAEQDIELHRAIVRRAGLVDLDQMWMSLIARVRSHFWQSLRRVYDKPIEVYEEHYQLIQAFRSGDVEQAVRALEANVTLAYHANDSIERDAE